MAISIFSGYGIGRSGGGDNSKAYITIEQQDGGGKLVNIITGSAPAGNVTINQSADIDTHKAFDGNYTIASFGQSLTQVIIRGLDIYAKPPNCSEDGGMANWENIQSWWNEFNFASNSGKRIKIGVYTGDRAASVFLCVACALVREIDANEYNPAVGKYQLTFVGIRKL